MLAGGVHSMIHPFGVTGFILLTAMSTRNDEPSRASRPFDRDRDGFVIGEGGGMLVLEELEHARARGATIFGEVAGHASTADAFRLTDSHDDGRGAVVAMRLALEDAGLNPEDVDYINAHGTSTKVNDSVETLAIKRVLGERAYKIPVSSTKSMTGHLIAAGGAVEAIVCLLAIRDGVVPPTINLEYPDPDCDLDYVPNVARDRQARRRALEQLRLRRPEHGARASPIRRVRRAGGGVGRPRQTRGWGTRRGRRSATAGGCFARARRRPGCQRESPTAASARSSRAVIGCSPIETIRSPSDMPACAAGPSGSRSMTSTPLSWVRPRNRAMARAIGTSRPCRPR